jgi:hypothetical protein
LLTTSNLWIGNAATYESEDDLIQKRFPKLADPVDAATMLGLFQKLDLAAIRLPCWQSTIDHLKSHSVDGNAVAPTLYPSEGHLSAAIAHSMYVKWIPAKMQSEACVSGMDSICCWGSLLFILEVFVSFSNYIRKPCTFYFLPLHLLRSA